MPEVEGKSIVMFFKKGLRDSSLIHKLTMKNPMTSKEMLATANKYALVEEATPESRRRRMSRATQTSLDRPRAMRRRGKWIIPSTRSNGCDTTRSIGTGQVNLKASCIAFAFSAPRESTTPKTATDSKVLKMRYSRRSMRSIKRKSPKIPRATSPKLTRRSTTSMVALSHMSQGGSRNSQPGRSWWSHPPPLST
jgi:hypothetical protein